MKTDETKQTEKPRRTRRAITPETALAHVIGTLGKLQPAEREQVLATAREWFAADLARDEATAAATASVLGTVVR